MASPPNPFFPGSTLSPKSKPSSPPTSTTAPSPNKTSPNGNKAASATGSSNTTPPTSFNLFPEPPTFLSALVAEVTRRNPSLPINPSFPNNPRTALTTSRNTQHAILATSRITHLSPVALLAKE